MTNASIAANALTAEAYETNVRHLLQAQRLATEASLAGNLAGAVNSVPVVITPDSSATFCVRCQMKYCDVVWCPSDEMVEDLLVDLVLPYVGIEELVSVVETTIEQARGIIDIVLV
jgi:hypothetical protein